MDTTTAGILVVSFGTTHDDTRIRTIDRLEEQLRDAFPERIFYRAWTSNIIRKVLKMRDRIEIDSIEEALKRMAEDGITDILVQSTHVINGFETDDLNSILQKNRNLFETMKVGKPLLTTQEDNEAVIGIILEQWKDIPENEAVVLMGHGTEHHANNVYAALNYMLQEQGCNHIFVGTVEGYPTVENVMDSVKKHSSEKVHLAPFMIVAGDHAKNDMAGDEDSWKNQFEKLGYKVVCHYESLGSNPAIRNIFVEHAREAK